MTTINESDRRFALIMSTLGFGVTFAIWGLLAGLMPILKKELGLTASEASLLVAAPVLIGSLGRLPLGILADRFGGKKVFSALLFLSVIPAIVLGCVSGYNAYLATAIFLGMAGASFPVGILLVSRWFPPERQGTALGIYGAGNIGQSIAVFATPVLAAQFGIPTATWTFAAVALIYAIIFVSKAKDAEWNSPPKNFGQIMKLFGQPKCWMLSAFYFQTFGAFVALSIYTPMLLKELFSLTPQDAGFRTAMFVVLATAARPLGGWLSDKIGSQNVLICTFAGLIPFALLMTSRDFGYFTVGALGAAVLAGLGNGGVFKLVPNYFPKDVGAITGLVGAAGGMGGFFPPIVLGYCKDHMGSYSPGFYFLAMFAASCLLILYLAVIRVSNPSETRLQPEAS